MSDKHDNTGSSREKGADQTLSKEEQLQQLRARELRADQQEGEDDPDLLVAALLHDKVPELRDKKVAVVLSGGFVPNANVGRVPFSLCLSQVRSSNRNLIPLRGWRNDCRRPHDLCAVGVRVAAFVIHDVFDRSAALECSPGCIGNDHNRGILRYDRKGKIVPFEATRDGPEKGQLPGRAGATGTTACAPLRG